MTTTVNGTTGVSKVQDGVIATADIADLAVTPAKLSQPMTLMTVKTATGVETYFDFTGIPSWAKKITLNLYAISTSGTSSPCIRVGSGSIQTTGYSSIAKQATGTSVGASGNVTSSFVCTYAWSAVDVASGSITLTKVTGDIWVCSGALSIQNTAADLSGGVSLSGPLDRIRITTVNGTDLFDLGSVSVMYEG